MVEIRKAVFTDAAGIAEVCAAGYRKTYEELMPRSHIENVIKEFYNTERIRSEIGVVSEEWNGWFVAADGGKVVGAGGGGFIGEETAELFVLYLDPDRKREGIGSRLLAAITEDQKARGAKEQWVSVKKGNEMGIPFYKAVGFELQGERAAYRPSEEGEASLRFMRRLKEEEG